MAARHDEEAGLPSAAKHDYSFEFAQREVRLGFVRKVFGILGLQLLITAGVTAAFLFAEPVRVYVFSTMWPIWTAAGVSVTLTIVLSVSTKLRRRHPYNLLALAAFTVCESVLVGTASAVSGTKVVLLAIGMTAAVVLGCVLFALIQSKYDLTIVWGAVVALFLAVLSAFLINLFIHTSWLYLGVTIGGVLLFSLHLMYDLQLLMRGRRQCELSADEYVFAALSLYLDIINIFYLFQGSEQEAGTVCPDPALSNTQMIGTATALG